MLELLLVLALILLNGFFAMSEMSVMTARKSRLKQMAQTSLRAQRALDLSEKPENFLSTVQIGITLIGVLTGLFGGEAIGQDIAGWILFLVPSAGSYAQTIGVGIAVALITFLTLIFGELVSQYPLAGGLYPWARRLIGRRWSWMVGWVYAWALFATIAAVATGAAPFLSILLGTGDGAGLAVREQSSWHASQCSGSYASLSAHCWWAATCFSSTACSRRRSSWIR